VPNGDDIAVNDDNKAEYVRAYIAAKLVTFYEYGFSENLADALPE
jgi:hypothetical protein